jgi:RNA-binding protein
MPLTPQQKRLLKQRGQTLADGCQLGKARLTDEFLDHLNGLLDRDELVKMRFTDLEGSARKELAKAVCQAVGAECVQVVGRTVLMYRKGPKVKMKAKGRNPGSPGAGDQA